MGEESLLCRIEAANKLLRDLQRYGRVRQGWLGADVRVTDATEFGSSARIRALQFNGPGYKGGCVRGMCLLRIGDRKITNPEDVVDASFTSRRTSHSR
jgi:S1-C subfamily serine protease